MTRLLLFVLLLMVVQALQAQRIDSVHVFRLEVKEPLSTSTANSLAWKLHQQDAKHVSVRGGELGTVARTLKDYTPHKHQHRQLKDLSHVVMVFSNGRPLAFGITSDLGCVINFTARTEYRIHTWAEHVQVRAMLARLLLMQ
jgi:hypothetical protein